MSEALLVKKTKNQKKTVLLKVYKITSYYSIRSVHAYKIEFLDQRTNTVQD